MSMGGSEASDFTCITWVRCSPGETSFSSFEPLVPRPAEAVPTARRRRISVVRATKDLDFTIFQSLLIKFHNQLVINGSRIGEMTL
jgi:hypothetical protein